MTEHAMEPLLPTRDPPAATMVVVGLGLIGGSVALAARQQWPQMRITGIDRASILAVAIDRGVIDEGAAMDDQAHVHRLLVQASLVVMALPVLGVCTFMTTHADVLRERTVTDTGSTKRAVLEVAERLQLSRFVGGHPMAGRPQGGLAFADASLFQGAKWFLCGHDHTDADARRQVRRLVQGMQAAAVEVSAGDHDRDVALTSHLPHLVANAVAEHVLAAGALDAAGGSLRMLLGVAGASFDVWGDTIATNGPAIRIALLELAERLSSLADAVDDSERMRDLFAHGRACRERLHGG